MIQLKVNGVARSFDGDPEMHLLWYLRDVLGLTGTKFGCGMALCGACTVHKNGEALRSCITPLSALAGAEMRTIEDISSNGLHPVQKMWMQFNVPQCGYCQSGQIMQATAAEPISAFVPQSKLLRSRTYELNHKRKPSRIHKGPGGGGGSSGSGCALRAENDLARA